MIILSNIRVISADMYFFLYLDNILNLTAYFIIKIVELISLVYYKYFSKLSNILENEVIQIMLIYRYPQTN